MANLILVIGLAGSGKSTWIKNTYGNKKNTFILSSDQLREELYGDINDQTHNEEVFQTLKDRAVEYLRNDNDVIIDATNLTRKGRSSIVDYIDKETHIYEWGYIKFVVIATPYYKCLENNMKRDRQVPEEVIKRMYKSFEFPTFTETVHGVNIIYPFTIDKEIYEIEHPYERYMGLEHENPHHTNTIGGHLSMTYNIMSIITTDKVLRKAAELHDIGKPFCKEFSNKDGYAHYYNHENVSAYEAMFYAKLAGFSIDEIMELCNLIQFHMQIRNTDLSERAKTRLKDKVGRILYYKLRMLAIADEEAH